MVVKRNKVPKRSKRIRGGTFFDELLNKINDDVQNTFKQWVHFIDILRNYISQEKCTEEETCNVEENMSEIDINAALQNLRDHFKVQSFGKGERMIVKNVSSKPSTKTISVLKGFDETFLSILNKVHGYVVNDIKNDIVDGEVKEKTSKFKSMMYIVSKLPNIKTSLTALVDTNIKSFSDRYSTILKLLKNECTGWIKGPLCSTAANLIGDDVSDLYEKLKTNADITNFQLTEDVLKEFIKDVLPIMIPKLSGIEEFKNDVIKLIELFPKVGLILTRPPPIGGKKSSRATHKEILGKQMKIYTKPNDKKEYVKHKGLLISIKEYKEHMKHAATGGAATTKKVILGKERCIYKVEGSKQDHIKYKGSLITVSDYKNLMKK
jgi:hypothetical protein